MDVFKNVSYISKHIWLRYQIGCTQKYKVELAYHAQSWGLSPATKIPRTKNKNQNTAHDEEKTNKRKQKNPKIYPFHQNGDSTLILTQGNTGEGA